MPQAETAPTSDRVFLRSDGLSDTNHSNNIPFGLNRLCDILENNKSKNPDMVIKDIERAMESFRANKPPSDDRTFSGFQTL